MDIGKGFKPPGHYVQHSYGLFPAPWPQDCAELSNVCRNFELLGMFMAKCIQDGRRVDIPLSRPFYKLLCTRGSNADHTPQYNRLSSSYNDYPLDNQCSNDSEDSTDPISDRPNRPQTPHPLNFDSLESSKEVELLLCDEIPKDSCKNDVMTLELGETDKSGFDGQNQSSSGTQRLSTSADFSWLAGILNRDDLEEIDPFRGKFLQQLDEALSEREAIQACEELSPLECEQLLSEVKVGGSENTPGAHFKDLW